MSANVLGWVCMASRLQSALADLDSSVQAVQIQLDRVGAGIDVGEELLTQAVIDARGHAVSLRNLISAESADAQWSDRESLGELIQELTAAAEARRIQQHARLLELASELDAGRVKHRFEARTSLLNGLRSRAAEELRTQAGLPQPSTDLPGPGVETWLAWAFNLQDDEDAAVLAELRANFPALEQFTGEMEETYWMPARPSHNDLADLPQQLGIVQSHDLPAVEPLSSASVEQPAPADSVREQIEMAIQAGNFARAVALCCE